jgi:DNA-binding NtrC family response regulator
VGKLERAHGGRLFWAEVAALPIGVQASLLRAMQDGVLERVGGRESIACDVRIVASTQEALEARVEKGAFRADLFYALQGFPLRVPPLRERPEDIAELARTKLREMSERLGREGMKLSREQLRELCAAPWHGNERALESYVERALIASTGKALTLPPIPAGPVLPRGAPGVDGAQALSESIREAIAAALTATKGKLYGADGAAALLGLPPSTLQSKMLKLGMQRADFER